MGPRIDHLSEECMVEAALEVIGGKWKLVILRHLLEGTRRFGELDKALPGITPRMLTRQLRELEADGLVLRTVYPQVPPKVEYSVTEIGESLRALTDQLEQWGHRYREHEHPRNNGTGTTAQGQPLAEEVT
ncbi:MarR family transcriptional regulator [Streptomyces albus]|uniref:MarR family transcriptional regulator n=1 Tax=Streptomyces albus (strain ATCC 21838 / DSM 41398 / FERM P-419 / JCM 4703 / NBRC 107858) TaxID=1081613 RepID=A0A0B5EQL8_STRA4|nr:MarR family transcriptional regulator [Streptomyces albus]AOU74772.1 MarR family transcriptional regulator [Streptomyces albus]AYN30583.1 transcriptional regulator [Streptomyces albus]